MKKRKKRMSPFMKWWFLIYILCLGVYLCCKFWWAIDVWTGVDIAMLLWTVLTLKALEYHFFPDTERKKKRRRRSSSGVDFFDFGGDSGDSSGGGDGGGAS